MLRLVLAFVLMLFAASASAQDVRTGNPGNAPNVQSPRSGAPTGNERLTGHVAVGEHAPDFSLVAAGGGAWRLKQSRGRWTAVFFTDRRDDLPRLEALAASLDSLHLNVIALLDEKPQALAPWRSGSRSPLVALADESGVIAGLYGLWDGENGRTRDGLFLLDPNGVVRLALLGQKVGAPSLRGLVQTAVEGL